MSVFTDLIEAPMEWAGGVDIGLDGWRRQYRIAVPSFGLSVIGEAIIGTARISGLQWEYITDDVHGCSYFHGGGPSEVPEAGELTLRLKSDDDRWASYRNAFYGPGTLIQIVVGNEADPTHPESQYVGIVTAWVGGDSELAKYSWIDITAIEPWGYLAGIEDPPVAPEGAGDTVGARFTRLLPDNKWEFNRSNNTGTSPPYLCAATDLSANRMVELRKLAQTFDAQVYGRKDGRLHLATRAGTLVDELTNWFAAIAGPVLDPLADWVGTFPGHVPYISGSLSIANDDRLLISALTLGHADGDHTVLYEQSFGKRHQPRTVQIVDLCFQDIYGDADLDNLAGRILDRGTQTERVSAVDVTSLHGQDVIRFLLAAEVTQVLAAVIGEASADGERTRFNNYSICRITHYLRPIGVRREVWDATVEFDVETGSYVDHIAY